MGWSSHAKQRQNPNYGRGEHHIDGPAPFREQDLEHRLEKLFTSQGYQPPRLPEAATRILALSRQEDVRIVDIHTALETDSLLVASVLKIVRSPVYGRSDVQSLKDALVRLGLKKIRDIVLEVAMSGRMFRAPGYDKTVSELQRHNRAVAHLVRVVAKASGFDSENAFLCGLLHDVGTMALLQMVAEDTSTERPSLDQVVKATRKVHASASARVARLWGLPEGVVQVLAAHHHLYVDGVEDRLAAAVAVAEAISVQLGYGVPPFVDPVDRKEVERAVALLALPMQKLNDVTMKGQILLKGI